MPSPQLPPDQIAEVSSLVAAYITAQREKVLPLAVPLSPAQRASLEGFFLPQVLDTRLLVLTESRVVNPPFYVPLQRMGFTNLPNFSTMAAVTFWDVVASHQRSRTDSCSTNWFTSSSTASSASPDSLSFTFADSSAAAGTMAFHWR
jgi:hypothetical protein